MVMYVSVCFFRSVGSSHHGSVRGSVRLGSTVQSAVSAPHQNNSSNHSDDTRPLVICVRNLPIRSSGEYFVLFVRCPFLIQILLYF